MTRDSYEMKKNLSRGSSLFGSTDPQVQLRTALETNDFTTFKKLVSNKAVKLDFVYPDNKTCLDIAVSEPNKQEFVKLLLQYNVDVNKINELHAAAPIHLAVENGNLKALEALLEDDKIDVNIQSKCNTALLLAIQKIDSLEDDGEGDLDTYGKMVEIYEKMVEMLLKAGCNPNRPNDKGVTAIHSAAQQGLKNFVTLILDYAKEKKIPIYLDTFKDRTGRTARYYLEKAFPDLLEELKTGEPEPEIIDADKLFTYLHRDEEDNFIRDFTTLDKNEQQQVLAANNGSNTLLQLATKKGFDRVVGTLLQYEADPNATCAANTSRPIAIACQYGHRKILKRFIEHVKTKFDAVNGESLIHTVVKGMRSSPMTPKANFDECLELLLKSPKININVNYPDVKNNTALHYAARNGDQETVLELLRNGACIGLRNKFGEPPLADIPYKTLGTYLDECITTNSERPGDDDYEIRMKYSFLVYPNNSLENELSKMNKRREESSLMDNSSTNGKDIDSFFAPETDALLYMTRNEDLKPLLKHPVITSFLYLKWQRISCLFYANITFYSLFWLSLILYIILGYGEEKKQSGSVEALNVITHVGAIIGLILLIFRELFQFLVTPTRYLKSLENWMEIILIFVTALIIGNDAAAESTKQQLSAVAILLSSAELVLLIGHFPTLSTNIVMLKTVSWNFFKFLLWYCILIIAFALSFYTLFRHEEEEDQKAPNPNNTGKEEEQEEDFFEDPGRSLFKTIVMLTGEFDAGSIKFSTFPVTSHLIFIVFVFMIPIVLFNLLNGLAVSDTQEIRADAELVGIVSRVKLISYFESVLIGSAGSYSRPGTCWSWLRSAFEKLNIIKPRIFCIKPFATRISLFPHYLPKHKITVKPNQDNRIEIPHAEPLGKYGDDYEDIEGGKVTCCFERCQNYRLDGKIVKNAKIVIARKTNVTELDEIKNQLLKYETKMENLEKTMKKVLQALEAKRY